MGRWAGEKKRSRRRRKEGGEESEQRKTGEATGFTHIRLHRESTRVGGRMRDGGRGGWGGMESGLKGSSNTLHSPAQQMPHSVWHSDLWACLYLYPHCVTPGPAQGSRHTNSYLSSRLPQLFPGNVRFYYFIALINECCMSLQGEGLAVV